MQLIRAVATVNPVGSRATVQEVISAKAVQGIIAQTRLDVVVADTARQCIRAAGAKQRQTIARPRVGLWLRRWFGFRLGIGRSVICAA
jgi:hypothetical protein